MSFSQPGQYGPEALLDSVGNAQANALVVVPNGYTGTLDDLGNLTVVGPPSDTVLLSITPVGGVAYTLTVPVLPTVAELDTVRAAAAAALPASTAASTYATQAALTAGLAGVSSSGGAVSSVAGRTGAVVLAAADVSGVDTPTLRDAAISTAVAPLETAAHASSTYATQSALSAKADISSVTTALAGKADSSTVTTALAGKADASATTSALALKADLVAGKVPASQLPSATSDASKANVDLSNVTAATGRTALGLGTAATTAATAYEAAGSVATASTADRARANHTGTQSADTLIDGTTNVAFLATERTKLAGVATAATANSPDATLLARANHTGTQSASTVTGLATVATSGVYTDLTSRPTLGTAAALNTGTASGNVPVLGTGGLLASAVVPAQKYDPVRNTYNFTPQSLYASRFAVANARNGTGQFRVNCIGDSTTAGQTTSGVTTPSASWPARLRSILAVTTGLPTGYGMLIPNKGEGTWVQGTGWGGAGFGYSGNTVAASSSTTGTLSLGPVANCIGFTVYYVINGNLGTANANIDGGANTLISATTGGPGIASATVSASVGSHTLNITTASGSFYVIGVEPLYANGTIVVANLGVGGSTTTTWVGDSPSGFGSLSSVKARTANLTILGLGINDHTAQLAVATYSSQMQTLITAAKIGGGDVLLLVELPPGNDNLTLTWQSYVDAVYALADSNGLPLVDLTKRWISNAVSSAYYADQFHPVALGYWDIAQALADVVSPA